MKSKLSTLLALAMPLAGYGQTSFTSNNDTGAWNTARWNNTEDAAPYDSAFTPNNDVSFTSGAYTFAGMGSVAIVGDVTVADGVTVNFSSIGSTFATGGNVRTLTVGSGAVLDFSTQAFSTAAGTGFIKEGTGVLALAGGAYSGGFTLNEGTVIVRGVDAFGAGASNVLTLNGGTVAANANRSFTTAKHGGGIVIGGDVQFGELAANVALASDTAQLTFSNNISLGAAHRTLTLGSNGRLTLSGVISNTGADGVTFGAITGSTGRIAITGTSNTFTGDITITGGDIRFSSDGSMGNADNDIYIDGGSFSTGESFTVGSNRTIYIGDTPGTAIRSTVGTVTINQGIADIAGKTGSLTKQGNQIVELGGVSTYTGNTSVNAGLLRLTTGDDRLPTGTVLNLGTAGDTLLGTIDLNGFNQTLAGLTSASGTNVTANTNVITSTTPATLTLNVGAEITYTFSEGTATNSGVISGAINLVKEGEGTQILGGANTYTGNTTVNAGTLVLAENAQLLFVLGSSSGVNNSLTGAGAVTLNGGFAIDTSAADSLTSGSWTLGDASTLTVSFGDNFSVIGFTDIGDGLWENNLGGGKSYTFNRGTGVLTLETIGGGSAFGSWAGPGVTPDGDENNDTVSNAIAWVLGAASPNENALALLPELDTTSDSEYVLFTFPLGNAAAADSNTVWTVEYGTNLQSTWTTAIDDGDNILIDIAAASPFSTVTIKFKRTHLNTTLAPDGTFFCRLEASVSNPQILLLPRNKDN